MQIANPEGYGEHVRTIRFDSPDTIDLRDVVQNYRGEVLFSLPLLVKHAELSGSEGQIICKGTGFYGINIEVTSRLPVKTACK